MLFQRAMGEDDVFAGHAPIDYQGIPFGEVERAMELLRTVEADVWGEWYLRSGVVDPQLIAAGGPGAIDEIWAGVLRATDAGWFGSCTWGELAAAGRVPLWCRLKPRYEAYFGAVGCWVTAGLLALAGRWMERELRATWVLPPDSRGLDRSEPVIAAPGFRGILPLSQFVGCVGRAAGLVPERIERGPHRLRELIYLHQEDDGGRGEDDGPGDADELEGPLVDPAGDGRWTIGFSDVQAYDEDERVDRFAGRLAGRAGVDRAWREDREVVIVEAALDRAAVQMLADETWAAAEDG